MFEISELKEKKLPELQEIAKQLNISKFRSLKKLDLVYQILDHQAANPPKPVENKQEKPQRKRRERIQRNNKNGGQNQNQKAIEFQKDSKEIKKQKTEDKPKDKNQDVPKHTKKRSKPSTK